VVERAAAALVGQIISRQIIYGESAQVALFFFLAHRQVVERVAAELLVGAAGAEWAWRGRGEGCTLPSLILLLLLLLLVLLLLRPISIY
jgi:hypothetical protein